MRFGHTPIFTAGTRTTAPPAPSGGTRMHGSAPPKPDLYRDALCRGEGNVYGNVWMYPDMHARHVAKAAASLCKVCPVFDQCDALKLHFGISAGRVRYSEAANRVEPKPVGVGAPKVCRRCSDEFYGPGENCTRMCAHEGVVEREARRVRFNALSAVPLLELLSRAEIADACGVSVRTVFRWRNGASLQLLQAERIARRLGVDSHELWPELEPVTRTANGGTGVRPVGANVGAGQGAASNEPLSPDSNPNHHLEKPL